MMAAPDLAIPQPEVIQAALALTDGKLFTYYPDTDQGDIPARHRYPKHMEFARATAEYDEVGLLGGNRSGKTTIGCFCLACHLTGWYPHWWEGRRFEKPVNAWACGTTSKNVRDILQAKLLGPKTGNEPGFIPHARIYATSPKIGTPDAVETAFVRYIKGGFSELAFKAYEQGREAFEGQEIHVILDDEEPPDDVYHEQMVRLTTTNGLMMLTMTPLMGLTKLLELYLPHTKAETPLATDLE